MSVKFYFDHNMPKPLAMALRQRGIDVLTAHEDGAERFSDPDIWKRSTELSRVVVTQDEDFLAMAQSAVSAAQPHPGLIYCDLQDVSTRLLVDDLELAALAMEMSEFNSKVFWIPM